MNNQEMLNLIKTRRTIRDFHLDRPIADEDLNQILEAATWAPTAHNMQNFEVIAIDDKSVLAQLGGVMSHVGPKYFVDQIREVSFSIEELLQKKTGFLAAKDRPEHYSDEAREGTLVLPPKPFGEILSDIPLLLMVLYDPNRRAPGSEGDFLGVMSLGFMLENMWLMATSLDIAFHIVSSLGDRADTNEIKRILNIPKNRQIVFGCRLGYMKEEKPSPRRDIEDFVSYNKYMQK